MGGRQLSSRDPPDTSHAPENAPALYKRRQRDPPSLPPTVAPFMIESLCVLVCACVCLRASVPLPGQTMMNVCRLNSVASLLFCMMSTGTMRGMDAE